jgi:hypothetical protein
MEPILSPQTTPSPEAASPFGPVLGLKADDLPIALRDQFLLSPHHGYRVVLAGRMNRVWRRVKWLGPMFSVLARFDILFPDTGRDVTAMMIVEARSGNGMHAEQAWLRTFYFRRPRHFNAIMAFDQDLHRVVECVGPARCLEIIWDVSFLAPSAIRIRTERIRLRLLGRQLPLPSWLSVEVVATEQADLTRTDEITVDLAVQHPWLGPVFGYDGRFRVSREYQPAVSGATGHG